MALSSFQRRFLVAVLALIVGGSLVALSSRALTPTLPDQVVYRPAPDQPRYVLVHVAGAVNRPGLYWVPDGARTADALQLALGPRADADLAKLNLAARLHDGDQVYVPAKTTPPAWQPPAGVNTRHVSPASVRSKPQQTSAGTSAGRTASQTMQRPLYRVNVNTASAQELQALPGIGPALAQRIVQERTAHGGFKNLQDLQRVKGLGPSKTAKLAPYVSF